MRKFIIFLVCLSVNTVLLGANGNDEKLSNLNNEIKVRELDSIAHASWDAIQTRIRPLCKNNKIQGKIEAKPMYDDADRMHKAAVEAINMLRSYSDALVDTLNSYKPQIAKLDFFMNTENTVYSDTLFLQLDEQEIATLPIYMKNWYMRVNITRKIDKIIERINDKVAQIRQDSSIAFSEIKEKIKQVIAEDVSEADNMFDERDKYPSDDVLSPQQQDYESETVNRFNKILEEYIF